MRHPSVADRNDVLPYRKMQLKTFHLRETATSQTNFDRSLVCVAVVEACVLHGLKRRIAGLLCSNKVAALFMKVAKSFTPAEELCRKVQELEQLIENR